MRVCDQFAIIDICVVAAAALLLPRQIISSIGRAIDQPARQPLHRLTHLTLSILRPARLIPDRHDKSSRYSAPSMVHTY